MRGRFSLTILLLIVMTSSVMSAGRAEPGPDEPEPIQAQTDETPPEVPPEDDYFIERNDLVDRYIVRAGIRDEAVIEAMRSVPRHEFVLPSYRNLAYVDRALPINEGQTISQPYIVAFMTEALRIGADSRVLEVGTGSGYQAAVLAEIAGEVHSIEIIRALAESARARLERLGYGAVNVVTGDGYYGLPEAAPFDAIIVTAAAGHVPSPLVAQLKPGGRMIIPVGPVYQVQVLILITKDPEGSVTTQQLLPVRFVPMTGEVLGQ